MKRFNLTEYLFQDNLRERPNHAALVFLDEQSVLRSYSYSELFDEIRGMAAYVQQCSAPQDRLLLRLRSEPRLAILFFAAILCGRIPIPVSPMLTTEELAYLIEDSAASCLLYDPSLQPAQSPTLRAINIDDIHYETLPAPIVPTMPPTVAEDPAYLIYTSGTTGYPRGVLHAHRSVIGRLPMREGWTGLCSADRLLHAGELNWSYTLGVGLMDVFAAGATAFLYGGDRHDPAIWPRLIDRHDITIFAAVPGLYRRMLKYGNVRPWAHFRHGLTAGDALPASVFAEWQDRTGTPLYEALGMTEISTFISTGPTMAVKPNRPGKPQKGRRIALLDPDTGLPFFEYDWGEDRDALPASLPTRSGLLAVHRSDLGLMLRYWNVEAVPSTLAPTRTTDPTTEDATADTIRPPYYGEWFSGGDMARFDEDGYLIYDGRKNDLMNAGGYRVSPAEVERVLHRHPAVADAAVLETALSTGLSIITACIVSQQDVTDSELLSHCHAHLADYKCPKRIVFMDHLPRTTAGKLRRGELLTLLKAT